MILGDNPKRCVIYFIYDKDGIIDDYVIDQLKDLRNNAQHIHCVINGKLCHDGKVALEKVADDIYVRENKGVDVGAYKAAIEYLTWDFIRTFDELVVMNNTCFGPVYPFKECFDWAKNQDVDLWGLTLDNKFGSDGPHLHFSNRKTCLQSYFVVFRGRLLKDKFLEDFFDEIPTTCDYRQSGLFYEYSFPGYFEDHGYKSAVYCKTEDLNYPLLHNPVALLKQFRMPLFKKRNFFHHYTDVLFHTAGEATAELISYLEKNTDYDMTKMWKSVLRTSSLSDIVRCAQLRRILPKEYSVTENFTSKMGGVFYFSCTESFDENLDFLENFPGNTDFLITVTSKEKEEILKDKLKKRNLNVRVKIVENKGGDASALLIGARDFIKNYDLVCFAHDKKDIKAFSQSSLRSFSFRLHENLFCTKEYILNVINMFEKETCLGMAFPGNPNHGQYLKNDATGWAGNFDNTKKLLQDFGVDVKINPKTLCVAPLGTCFWFRPKSLEKLMNGFDGNGWSYTDFPAEPTGKDDCLILHAIKRAYAYFAQDAGFYPVYLYNDKYAAIDLTNLEFQTYYGEAMRAWCDAFVLDSLGYRKFQDIYGHPWTEIADEEIIRDYSNNSLIRNLELLLLQKNQEINQIINFEHSSLKYSLKIFLANFSRRFPAFWKLLWPARKSGKLMWKIYKKIK